MPIRGSLKHCVECAVHRFKQGNDDFANIIHKPGAKYYTLLYTAELEARRIQKPHDTARIVLCCSGGELASIIGTAQMNLDLN